MQGIGTRAVLLVLWATSLSAALVRVEITDQRPVLDGQSFGRTGAYEFLRGRAYFAVRPDTPRVTDLALAPRNSQGQVEFSADFVILRPANATRGNGTLVVEAPNRGGMGMLPLYNRARASLNPVTAADYGDGFLMREGYTLAWIGWQHDVPVRDFALRAHVPVAQGVTGWVRGEYTPSAPVTRFSLGDANHIPYPVSDPATLKLTVRDRVDGPRRPLPAAAWRLSGTELVLAEPATPGRIYEFVYRAESPAVAGLGLVAMRDFVAAIKSGQVVPGIKRAIGVGSSQSAMALKALVYEGFNADEQQRIVFDGLQPHVAGGRRATFERFAQPSRTSGPYRNASFSTTDQFPYSDAEDTELATHRRDSVLARAQAARVVPKIIYTNSSYEYWGSASSLTHTTLDGRRDLRLPETTRLYLLAGGQHGPAAFPPQIGAGQNLPNWNDYRWILRAILTDLQQWLVHGTAPPESRYPRLAAGTLVKGQPPAYGVQYLDFGPEYLSRGLLSQPLPKLGPAYVPLVPRADEDGNDVAGVKMPWVAEPLGAFTGWNLRTAAIGAAGELLGQTGSYLPFSVQRVRERYANKDEYLRRTDAAARALVDERFLLGEDLPQIRATAGRIWDWSQGALSAR